jgi:N-acetylglucosaminyl-diphospho-decaprenol L-rhamnosyltransferase
MGPGALHSRHHPSVMSGTDVRVSAILVSYNSKEDLLKNLPSLLEATSRETDEVILVDNDSTDSTSEVVGRVFPGVRLIEAGSNLGFGGAVNLAAVQARGRTLLVLNPDLRIHSQAIDALVARVDRAGGVAGPVLCEPASGKRLYGIRFDLMGLPIPSERPMPAFYVQGCALAISSALFRRIGGFDERYFLFAEDADLCWRATASGAPVEVVVEAEAVHSGGASEPGGYVRDGARRIADRRFSLRERNTFAMFIANAPFLLLVVHVPLHILKTAAFCVSFTLLGHRPLAASLLKGLVWNLEQLPTTLERRRARPGASTLSSLKGRVTLVPAAWTHFRTDGLPKFVDQ